MWKSCKISLCSVSAVELVTYQHIAGGGYVNSCNSYARWSSTAFRRLRVEVHQATVLQPIIEQRLIGVNDILQDKLEPPEVNTRSSPQGQISGHFGFFENRTRIL